MPSPWRPGPLTYVAVFSWYTPTIVFHGSGPRGSRGTGCNRETYQSDPFQATLAAWVPLRALNPARARPCKVCWPGGVE
jgi:hypothetical protein